MPLEYAGPRYRAVAFLVDWAVLCAWLIALVLVRRPWVWYLAAWPACGYFVWLEAGPAHASWGKQQLRLLVMEKHGRPLTIARSALHSVLKFAPWAVMPALPAAWLYAWSAAWIGAALLTIALVPRHRAWYDLLAGSAVIRRPADPPAPSPSA